LRELRNYVKEIFSNARYQIFGQTNLMYITICTCSRSIEKFRIVLWHATFGSSGGCQKWNVEKKEPWSQRSPRYSTLSLERTEFYAKLSQPERPTSFRPRGRTEKRASLEKRRQNAAREGDEGIDIGNGGSYIFQNIGYLRGKAGRMYSYGPPCLWRAIYFEIEGNGRRFTPDGVFSTLLVLDHPRPPSAVQSSPGRDHIKISNKYKNGWVQLGYVLPHF